MRFLGFLFAICLSLGSAQAQAQETDPASLLEQAFEAAQWGSLSSAGTAIRQTGLRKSITDEHLSGLLRQQQVLVELRKKAEAKIATLDGNGDDVQANSTRLAGEIEALGLEITALEREIETDFPRFHQLTKPRPLDIKQVQALLQPDEGLVFAFSGVNDTFVWAITPDRAAWHRVGVGRYGMAESVALIRRSLIQASLSRSAAALDEAFVTRRIAPFERSFSMLMYSELLRPLESHLKDVKHLFTIMDGPLTGLPLSLLITDEILMGDDDDPEALRRTGWLFQRHALTTLPSVESLAVIRADPSEHQASRQMSFLGFGDPDLYGQAEKVATNRFFRSGGVDLETIRALAPLPNTRIELRQIAATLNAGADRLYLGVGATETAVKAAPLATADVIVFATHGLLSGELMGLAEPALVLSPPKVATPADDGLLTASEIAGLKLNAEWIVLSACNTAGGDGRPDGEGLSGLARAFLFAGARSIMVSHWPVRDDAAARLTTDTFAALAGDGSPRRKAKALQIAMQAMLSDESDPSLAHPAAWAPFVLVGDGGK